jgi:hypothetical protein
VAFHVERLIAKEQDLMLRQRLVQLLDLAVAERPGERQAVYFGANARRNRRDIDGFVAHGVTSRVRGIYEFSGTAATAAAITALSRRTVAISFRSMTRLTNALAARRNRENREGLNVVELCTAYVVAC